MRKDRLEFLKARQKQIGAALAAEHIKLQKHERRIEARFDSMLGCAVRKAGAGSDDFRRVVMTAISAALNEKEKSFFAERGWL